MCTSDHRTSLRSFALTWLFGGALLAIVIGAGLHVSDTRRPFFRSVFGFVRMPRALLLTICAISALYLVATELVKRPFFRSAD